MIKLFTALLILLIPVYNYSQSFIKSGSDIAFPNYRIYPSTITQTEVLAENHPFEKSTMFVTANAITFSPSFFVSEGIYVTTNGGSSWFGSDTCYGNNIFFHYGDPGITIDKNGTFLLTRLARGIAGLYSHYSTNYGSTWSSQYTISDTDVDRAVLASDNNHLSSFFGRSYAAWVRLGNEYPVMYSYTDNGGVSWSQPSQVNFPPQRCAGGDILLGLDGKLFLCWAGVISASPNTETHTGFAFSTNGGADWNIKEIAFPMNGVNGLLPEKQNIRVNGLPRLAIDTTGGSRNGWIYIITTQKNRLPAGSDPDIILNRSSDGGSTWSEGIRVNQDQLNNGKIQYFPAVHVDDYGGLNVIYYDDRNTTSDSAGLFLSRSMDGGDTWAEYEISDHNFKPTPIGGIGQGYQGDNIEVTSIGNILYPFWMDNSSGIYQIWTSHIDLTVVGVEDFHKLSGYRLYQNYPNPFNPSTQIKFTLPQTSYAEVKLYDLQGSQIALLHKGETSAGSYEINLNGADLNLSTGVYFITLTAGDFRQTIKAVLLK